MTWKITDSFSGESITVSKGGDWDNAAVVMKTWYQEAPQEVLNAVDDFCYKMFCGKPAQSEQAYLGLIVEKA